MRHTYHLAKLAANSNEIFVLSLFLLDLCPLGIISLV